MVNGSKNIARKLFRYLRSIHYLFSQIPIIQMARRHSVWLFLLLLTTFLTMLLSAAELPGLAHRAPNSTTVQVIAQTTAQGIPDGNELIQRGKQLYQTEQYSQALPIWQQAVTAFQATGDTIKQAEALSNLSLTAQQLGQWADAEAAIQTAIALLNSNHSTSSKTGAAVLAQALDVQGRLQLSRGQAELALESWKQAAQIYKQLGDSNRLIRNQINQAQALQSLGFYRQAQTQLTTANATLQDQPDSPIKAIGLRSLGTVLRVTGNLEESHRILQQSLTVAQAIEDTQEMGEVLFSLGDTARAQNNTSTALIYYQQAATTASAATAISAQLRQFSILINNSQQSVAQTQLPQLLKQLESLPLSRTAIYARIYLAQNWMGLKNRTGVNLSFAATQEPAQLLEAAVQQARSLQDQRAESYALGSLGHWYETTQHWGEAEQQTQQALMIAQSIDASDLIYQWQWQLGRLLAQREEIPAAIVAYEEAIKILQSLRYDLVSMSRDEQFSFREQVEPAYRQLIELLLRSTPDSPPHQENLVKARETLEFLQVAELRDFFREACADIPVLIDQVVEKTDEQSNATSRAAVMYPIILPHQLNVVLKLPDDSNLIYFSTPVEQDQVTTTLRNLRQRLTQPETFRAPQQEPAKQVYDWLIRPAEAVLQKNQINTLVFVLDGYLKNIPMATLYDGKNYLIENYSIALTPGLQLPDPKPLNRHHISLLFAGLSQAVPNEKFAALPSVESEKQGILNLIPHAFTLLDQAFTKERLQTTIEASPFEIVHFATHGVFSTNQDETFILAANGRIKVTELDQVLRVREQIRRDPIELLVLSACQTAEGDERAALGLAGVAVRAGARSTLASLWSVYDEVGAPLMVNFYRQLIEHPDFSKAEALRQAQLAVLNRPDTHHPLYWAPYVLIGNWL
jgi:CHAT domain-containing protein/uncharacterized protein HemY